MKRILVSSLAAIAVTSQVSASVVFSDDFSYANGNLVGQGGWVQTGTGTPANTVQVSGGLVPLLNNGQDVNAPLTPTFPLVDGTSFYVGANLNLSAALTGDYFFNVSPSSGSTFFFARLYARSSGTGFQMGYAENSGGATAGITYGTTVLDFNQNYRVVLAYNMVAGALNNTASLYVSPSDLAVEGNNTPYLTDTYAGTTPEDTVLGAVNLRQGSATAAPTLVIDDLNIATTFAEAATFTPVPEPSAFALAGLGIAALLIFRRKS